MSTLTALRRSRLARVGVFALLILWYIVYVMGQLLEFGFVGPVNEAPVMEIGLASVGLIVGILLVRWFFRSKVDSSE